MADTKDDLFYRDFSQSLIPETKSLEDRFCFRPFEHVEIMHGHGPEQEDGFGDVYVCCSGWLSKKIGNYLKDDLGAVWNSPEAQEIRHSIYDGSFRYCNRQACQYILKNTLPYRRDLSSKVRSAIEEKKVRLERMPSSFFLCYDRSCNLSCASCRREAVHFKNGPGLENPLKLNDKLMRDLFSVPTDRRINLKITGSGDPFASLAFRSLLERLDGRNFPGLEIELYTNGLLFTQGNWEKLKHISSHVKVVSVSIDAATETTYRKTRGGSWRQLMANLEFIGRLREQKVIRHFATNYVVQTANFFECAQFVEMCLKLHVDLINFSFVSDWSTWDKEEFERQCIWRKDHPQFSEFIDSLKNSLLNAHIVALGPLKPYRDLALGPQEVLCPNESLSV